MSLLNLGCGNNFHPDWINIDFNKTGPDVIAHNLRKGIPFGDNVFDVVYHSHILEHFTKQEGIEFIKECRRVLKSGAILRIAVPDLEVIVENYLINLKGAREGDPYSMLNYEWILLEMYDQCVRHYSGGEMGKYLSQIEIPNKDYIFKRIGYEAKNFNGKDPDLISENSLDVKTPGRKLIKRTLKRIYKFPKQLLISLLFKRERDTLKSEFELLQLGRFMESGEIHQWMYDSYSLGKLLHDCGFSNIKKVSAFESSIENFDKYQLDSENGVVKKPDSLFMEAIKSQ